MIARSLLVLAALLPVGLAGCNSNPDGPSAKAAYRTNEQGVAEPIPPTGKGGGAQSLGDSL